MLASVIRFTNKYSANKLWIFFAGGHILVCRAGWPSASLPLFFLLEFRMRLSVLLASLMISGAALAAAPEPAKAPAAAQHLPYSATADAKADVAHALAEAKAAHVPVLLIFGANWCEDCRALDKALKEGKNAELMKKEFRVVKVDVGNFDHNLDVAQAYGNPLKKASRPPCWCRARTTRCCTPPRAANWPMRAA